MDTLTGSKDYPSNNDIRTPSQSEIIEPNNSATSADSNNFSQFLLGSFYQLSPEQFALVSNLDPMQISDREFLQAAQQFSDEDFVRGVYKSYLNREPTLSESKYWTTEIKLKKSGRIFIFKQIRDGWEFKQRQSLRKKRLFPTNAISNFLGNFCFLTSRSIRQIIGIQHLEILAAINFILEQNDSILAAWIDQPKTGDKIKNSTYCIAGWIVGKKQQPVTIRLSDREIAIAEAPLTGTRPDVSKVYCLESETHNWGFYIFLKIKQLPARGDLQLQAVFADGSLVPICSIEYRKY